MAEKRILLLERNQFRLNEADIRTEIEQRRILFRDLAQIQEIWFAETVFGTQNYVGFKRYDGEDLAATLEFRNGRLTVRSANGAPTVVRHR